MAAWLISSVLFALAYFYIVARIPQLADSPYEKASPRRRWCAATIDLSLVVWSVVLYLDRNAPWAVVAGAAYLLLRDSFNGRGIGKLICGVTVIDLEKGSPAGAMKSVRRNFLLLVPGATLAAMVLEAVTIGRDPLGMRLGDALARTQVVDGFGLKELVAELQRQLRTARDPMTADPVGRPVIS